MKVGSRFVCVGCGGVCETTSSHADVGGCRECHRPLVYWYDTSSWTRWCDGHKARFAVRPEDDGAREGVVCPRCGDAMRFELELEPFEACSPDARIEPEPLPPSLAQRALDAGLGWLAERID